MRITKEILLQLRNQKKYGGQFVAQKGFKVLAAAPSIGHLIKILKAKNIYSDLSIVIGFIPPEGVVHAHNLSLSVLQ